MTITRKSPLARSPMPRSSRPVGILGQASHAKIRARKCAQCRQAFEPARPMAKTCGPACAELFAAAIRAKVERKADKARKQALKGRADWMKEAQVAFNSFIRARDFLAGFACISSGAPLTAEAMGGGFDAGHYRSVGSAPHLRFIENNCHGQTKHDNRYLSGNAVSYRIGLIARIGLQSVEALESDNVARKYSITELQGIKAHYKARLKELQA